MYNVMLIYVYQIKACVCTMFVNVYRIGVTLVCNVCGVNNCLSDQCLYVYNVCDVNKCLSDRCMRV